MSLLSPLSNLMHPWSIKYYFFPKLLIYRLFCGICYFCFQWKDYCWCIWSASESSFPSFILTLKMLNEASRILFMLVCTGAHACVCVCVCCVCVCVCVLCVCVIFLCGLSGFTLGSWTGQVNTGDPLESFLLFPHYISDARCVTMTLSSALLSFFK